MDAKLETLLAELDVRNLAERKLRASMPVAEAIKISDGHLLSVGRYVGQLLNTLIKESKAQTILEVGTSYGYSTMWLAEAASQTGGKVITLDRDAGKQLQAKAYLEQTGLAGHVSFIAGDAMETIPMIGATYDFVLIDAWKGIYIPCFDLVYPKLNPGAIVVADNMLYPPEVVEIATEYRNHVRTKSDVESVLLPTETGIFLSRYKAR